MALSNALFAGLSGLDVNQVKLNVVSNNIANVNTVAFKATRVLFKPQFYVTDTAGSEPTDEFGGTNPSQRGLGAVVSGLDRDLTPGSIETTGKNTDLAIDGDGYFIVTSDEQKYTRNGSFTLNSAKELVTAGGDFVQGYGIDKDFNIVAGQLGNITIPLGSMTIAQATTRATMTGNLNSGGAVATGASVITSQLLTTVGGGTAPTAATLLTGVASTSDSATPLFSVGQTFSLEAQKGSTQSDVRPATYQVTASSTLGDLASFFESTLGINTTVPDDGNATTPTAGVTVEADSGDPSSARLAIVGNLGAENALYLTAKSFKAGPTDAPLLFNPGTTSAGIASNAAGESIRNKAIVYDSLGNPIEMDVTAVFESKATTGNLWRFFVESPDASGGTRAVASGTLLFDGLGRLLKADGTNVTIPRDNTGAVTPLTLDLSFDQIKGYSDQDSKLTMTPEDGSAIGTLTTFSIGTDGVITGMFSNDVRRTLGQIVTATFSNSQGLVDRGSSLFVQGPDSGPPVIGTPGTLGAGKIVAGSLELSNVDLSEEFINLIIASTGFSAASRVISTSDQLIQELLNTSR